jgi:hypothetical protein
MLHHNLIYFKVLKQQHLLPSARKKEKMGSDLKAWLSYI